RPQRDPGRSFRGTCPPSPRDSHRCPAWKSKPSWYQISSADRMMAPENQERMAARIAPRKIGTLDASHASLASRAEE
ncbi:hypothetical protein ACV343_32885, partial [Pseudomonas aeruginosa]